MAVYYVINTTTTGGEIVDTTKSESLYYCEEVDGLGFDICFFPNKQVNQYIPQPGDEITLVGSPTLGKLEFGDGTVDDGVNFPHAVYNGFAFIAHLPSGGTRKGHLLTPDTELKKGSKLAITGPNPGDGTTNYTESANGVERSFRRFVAEEI